MPKIGQTKRTEENGVAANPLGGRQQASIACIEGWIGLFTPMPDEWLYDGRDEYVKTAVGGAGILGCIGCDSWERLREAWRVAMEWTDGLEKGLVVSLACVTSTTSVGDQLWVKLMGPASSGKSTICEGLSVCTEYVIAKSTIRGFHSGWKGEGGEDHSLIAQLSGMTLVTKDGDTLLQSPGLGQILAEARDIYDSVSRSHYRNAQGRDYAGIRSTWILAGTASLRALDDSELGERFLDCVIMEGIDDELEDLVLLRVADRAGRNLAMQADGSAETHYDPDMAKAMAMTGGYVRYLRQNSNAILSEIEFPQESKLKCARLGKFVAFMRARPSKIQSEDDEREFAARLVSQHIRLAGCVAAVLNKKVVDDEVMHRVWQVAMDTARGVVLKIVEAIYRSSSGLENRALALITNLGDEKVPKLMRFLRKIGVVRRNEVQEQGQKTLTTKFKWILTPTLTRLYEQVRRK